MKNNLKIAGLLISLFSAGGITYLNVEDDLDHHEIKEYNFRSLDRDLYLTFHHSATKGKSLKEISEYHVETKGWAGIAYHFAINWEGTVFELQPLTNISYHSKGHNTESIGIVFIGNYQEKDLPDVAVRSAELLIKGLEDCLVIVGVRGHRDVRNTLCPGDYAYKKIEHLFY